jgi:hypothetical protein
MFHPRATERLPAEIFRLEPKAHSLEPFYGAAQTQFEASFRLPVPLVLRRLRERAERAREVRPVGPARRADVPRRPSRHAAVEYQVRHGTVGCRGKGRVVDHSGPSQSFGCLILQHAGLQLWRHDKFHLKWIVSCCLRNPDKHAKHRICLQFSSGSGFGVSYAKPNRQLVVGNCRVLGTALTF